MLRRLAHTFAASAGVIAIALLLTGPFVGRIYTTFGEPLGPSWYRDGLSMERHDPPAVFVNALRIGASTLVVPIPVVNAAVADGVMAISRAVAVDPQDPAITQSHSAYPNARWRPDEDHAPYPVQSALVLIGIGAALLGRRVPGVTRAYAATALGALILFAAMLKWQIWGNRLVLPALVLGAPLAGWWLARMLPAVGTPKPVAAVGTPKPVAAVGTPRLVTAAMALVVTVAFVGGYGSVLFGWPRRLIGHTSVFVTDPWEQRFIRQPGVLPGYRYAADRVKASGARRVGMYTVADGWEYPWWRLLPGRELVTVSSIVPGRPATPITSVDAFVCAGGEDCRRQLHPGWRFETVDGWVGVGLPVHGSGSAAPPGQ
jgi:hypothetical protein